MVSWFGLGSRGAILEMGGHLELLQALHAAEFEEAAIVHEIAEALGRLCDDSSPDNSSTVSQVMSASVIPLGHVTGELPETTCKCTEVIVPFFARQHFTMFSLQGGKKLLHWAAQFGDLGLVRRLLENNPVSDVGDSRGNRPLHLAVLNNHT